LERDWEARRAEVERLERESAARPALSARLVDPAERARNLALAQDRPARWQAATTTQVEREQLLGFLIKDVCLTRTETTIEMAIRWRTEACTVLNIPRPKRACDARRTDPTALARVRELAAEVTDRQIAEILNQEGFRSGTGRCFTKKMIIWIRYKYKIPSCCPEGLSACAEGYRADGRCLSRVAAEVLQVNVSTIKAWCHAGVLDGIEGIPDVPWWIQLTPEIIARLRKPTRRSWPRNSAS
jgi:hypothetical protein